MFIAIALCPGSEYIHILDHFKAKYIGNEIFHAFVVSDNHNLEYPFSEKF